MEGLVARPPAHRVIPGLVDGLAISDGQAKLPVLGAVMGYHLTFTEATGSEAPDFALVTVQARAHQNCTPNSQGLRWDGTPYSYPPIGPQTSMATAGQLPGLQTALSIGTRTVQQTARVSTAIPRG